MRPSQRLAELATTYDLPSGAAKQLMALLELVSASPHALTAVRDVVEGVEVHVADSLTGVRIPAVRSATTLADLGSGGGFPGLVLAVALPETAIFLVESVTKKADFLADAARALGIEDRVTIVADRVESWEAGAGSVDVVTARALAPLGVLVEYSAPLLVHGGTMVAWKGRRQEEEEADAGTAAAAVGMSPLECVPTPRDAVQHADQRHLYLSLKVADTPERYPRRPGMARKRPHRASTPG